MFCLLALMPTHGSLLASWAALGGKASPWRLVVAIVGVLIWIRCQPEPRGGEDLAVWIFVLFVTMCFLSALLLIARFFGAELTDAPADGRQPLARPEGRWEQFSLGALLSWTAALAVLLGSLHYIPHDGVLEVFDNVEACVILAAIVGGTSLIALAAIWITLGTRWPGARYVLLLLTAVVAVGVLYLAVDGTDFTELAIFCAAQVFWTAGSLWLIRLAGYRLIWRRRVRL